MKGSLSSLWRICRGKTSQQIILMVSNSLGESSFLESINASETKLDYVTLLGLTYCFHNAQPEKIN